jgi:hypothetical protein
MYTNSTLLRITNLSERGAVSEILASLSMLREKNKLISGASLSVRAVSKRFTNPAQHFLTTNLKSEFKEIDLRFNDSSIIATITPK